MPEPLVIQPHPGKVPYYIGTYLLVLCLVLYTNNITVLSLLLSLWVLIGLLNPSVKLKTTAVIGLFLCSGIFVGNLFWGTGRVILEAGPVFITQEAFVTGAEKALRVAVLIFSAKVLFSGKVTRLTQELRWLLRPLQRIGLRTEQFLSLIEETLNALPEVQQRISKRASEIRYKGNSKVRAMAIAIYETFIQELQNQ